MVKEMRSVKLLLITFLIFISCENSSLKKEKHWFDYGFEVYFSVATEKPENWPPYVSFWGNNNIIDRIDEQARNRKEREYLIYALESGSRVIQNICLQLSKKYYFRHNYNSPTSVHYDSDKAWLYNNAPNRWKEFVQDYKEYFNYLIKNKEELKKNGWKNYLTNRKFKE